MAHLQQVVEVKVTRGRFLGEGEPIVHEFRVVGRPYDPVTDEEREAALWDAVYQAVGKLLRLLSPSRPPVEAVDRDSAGRGSDAGLDDDVDLDSGGDRDVGAGRDA